MSEYLSRVWVAAVTEEAKASELHPSLLLGGCRKYKVARARWRAFKRVLDDHPRISIKRLAIASGFDHTTILHGLKRLSGASTSEIKFGGTASGRRPLAAPSLMEAAE
jgi:hypothetical protein